MQVRDGRLFVAHPCPCRHRASREVRHADARHRPPLEIQQPPVVVHPHRALRLILQPCANPIDHRGFVTPRIERIAQQSLERRRVAGPRGSHHALAKVHHGAQTVLEFTREATILSPDPREGQSPPTLDLLRQRLDHRVFEGNRSLQPPQAFKQQPHPPSLERRRGRVAQHRSQVLVLAPVVGHQRRPKLWPGLEHLIRISQPVHGGGLAVDPQRRARGVGGDVDDGHTKRPRFRRGRGRLLSPRLPSPCRTDPASHRPLGIDARPDDPPHAHRQGSPIRERGAADRQSPRVGPHGHDQRSPWRRVDSSVGGVLALPRSGPIRTRP